MAKSTGAPLSLDFEESTGFNCFSPPDYDDFHLSHVALGLGCLEGKEAVFA